VICRNAPSNLGLPQSVRRHALAGPSNVALVFAAGDGTEKTVTYGRLDTDASSIGKHLASEGIARGDVVALAMEHGYPVIAGFLGAMHIGAVPVILPYASPSTPDRSYREQAGRLLREVGARAVLTLPRTHAALADLGQYRPIAWTLPEPGAEPSDAPRLTDADPAQPAYLQLTSGSTRTPRGVVIPHSAVLRHLEALSEGFPFGRSDVSVGWLPVHHDMGLVTQILLPLAVGGTSVLLAPHAWLRRPVALMRAVDQHRGTFGTMPNFGFEHCLRRIPDAEMAGLDLGSLRTLVCGGEPIRAETMERFATQFSRFGLSPKALMAGYGMAENTVGITHGACGGGIRADHVGRAALESDGVAIPAGGDEPDAVDIVCCGVPFSGTQVDVVDGSGATLPERRVGEIRICGDALFAGYRQGAGATVSVQREGWHHTGDRGYLAGGELYVLGRQDDLIITAGRNVSPEEIEAAIVEPPEGEIRRAVAFGVRDDRLGTEVPVAVVEIRGRIERPREHDIGGLIRSRVKAALDVELGDVRLVRTGWIAVTTSGKVARRACRSKYSDAGFERALTGKPDSGLAPFATAIEVESELVRLVADATGRADVDRHAPLADLGLHSLRLVHVVLLLEERLGRQIPVEHLAVAPTISRLAALVSLEEAPAWTLNSPALSHELLFRIDARRRNPLRKRLLQRGPALRRRALLSYETGSRLLHALASSSGGRRRLFGPEIALLGRWMERVPLAIDPEIVIRQSLMVNSWITWRQHALAEPDVFARWVTLRGSGILDDLASEGRGVVLVLPHTLLRRLLPRLPSIADANLSIVGNIGTARMAAHGLSRLAGAVSSGVPLSRMGVRSAQMVHALRTLAAGGRAVIMSDDDEGAGGIDVPFHGCTRRFRPGAAELAVRADAALVPIFASMGLEGRIVFECQPPVSVEGADHAARVRSLVQGYAARLADRYTVDLGAMDWYILRKFVGDRPAQADDAPG